MKIRRLQVGNSVTDVVSVVKLVIHVEKTKIIKTVKSNPVGTGNQDYAFFISDFEENIWIQLIVKGVRSILVQQTKLSMKIPGKIINSKHRM